MVDERLGDVADIYEQEQETRMSTFNDAGISDGSVNEPTFVNASNAGFPDLLVASRPFLFA